jgi:hypothetical protein
MSMRSDARMRLNTALAEQHLHYGLNAGPFELLAEGSEL